MTDDYITEVDGVRFETGTAGFTCLECGVTSLYRSIHAAWHRRTATAEPTQMRSETPGVEPGEQPFAMPDRIAIDAKGYGWRVWDDEELWSMVPVNPDNSPILKPVTWFVKDTRPNEAEYRSAHVIDPADAALVARALRFYQQEGLTGEDHEERNQCFAICERLEAS